MDIRPENTVCVVLSFEGPDPYSQAGGLGVRAAELADALAIAGYTAHLIFIGDPQRPAREEKYDGRLTLHRWGQWISQYHPNGVYHGEEDKLNDWNASVPAFVVNEIATPAIAEDKLVVILAEEWHTAESLGALSDMLYYRGLRQRALLFWNANNIFSFNRLDWSRLTFVSQIVTVSRYMRHYMWNMDLNPLVIPNGIPSRLIRTPDPAYKEEYSTLFPNRLVVLKIGRFDPDKRWMMAVEAIARLKERGHAPLLLMRGGIEPHGQAVLSYARHRGLHVHDVTAQGRTMEVGFAALRNAPADADVLNLRFFLPEDLVHLLYNSVEAVLANSGHEPFGLVGLEVMAAGGVAVTGCTGEDYAVPFQNSIVVETDDPAEIVGALSYLRQHPEQAARIRAAGQETARMFTWDEVLMTLRSKMEFLANRQGL